MNFHLVGEIECRSSGIVIVIGVAEAGINQSIARHHGGGARDLNASNIATLRTLYRRRAILYQHQAWAIEYLGMTRFERTDESRVLKPLSDLVRAGRSTEHLQVEARELLYDRRFVIRGPPDCGLGALCHRNGRIFDILHSRPVLGKFSSLTGSTIDSDWDRLTLAYFAAAFFG